MPALPTHAIFEALAYFAAGQTFWWQRRRQGDTVSTPDRWLVLGAAIAGAALGSRLLAAVEDPAHFAWTLAAFSGKTIVGALLGGLLAVEGVKKKRIGVTRSTGDLYAVPLCVGIAVGRMGCFLAGLADQTHGLPTSLPWGYDYGDGLRRHPAQLYEVAFAVALGVWLHGKNGLAEGDRFKLFLSSYLGFRFLADFLKPGVPLLGLTTIQWACAAGLLYYARDIRRWLTKRDLTSSTTPPSRFAPDACAK